MIAILLTALFAFAGGLAIIVLWQSVRDHARHFIALRKNAQQRAWREVRYTLITTEVRPVPGGNWRAGNRAIVTRPAYGLVVRPSRIAA